VNKVKAFVITALAVSVSIPSFVSKANAHQSGCHRWHSCPSDWGTYVCGDTGHSNYCPEKETLYDRYMVLGCNTQRGNWEKAKAYYNSALIASGKPEQSRESYPSGKPLSFYAEQSIAGKNRACKS
jgi:hypothetical protein